MRGHFDGVVKTALLEFTQLYTGAPETFFDAKMACAYKEFATFQVGASRWCLTCATRYIIPRQGKHTVVRFPNQGVPLQLHFELSNRCHKCRFQCFCGRSVVSCAACGGLCIAPVPSIQCGNIPSPRRGVSSIRERIYPKPHVTRTGIRLSGFTRTGSHVHRRRTG